jgi:serine/threonine-protein kinase
VARVSNDPLKRRVALKILKGAYATNKKILNRTRDEARLLSRINHPNIVRVERLMEINSRPIVVMEHVQGVSLDLILYRFRDGLPPAIALEMARQTCVALHVAYQEALGEDGRPMRVIHRDIKPSNILSSIHGEIKVVDFGIAKGEFEGREANTESVVMGSRPYMAPERLDGQSDSPAVDVYSTGMSLFELLTGRTMSLSINPVTHETALNRQLQYIQVPGMSQSALEDLRDLVRRMCAYTRDYRPSAIESARELEQLVYAIEPRYRIGLEEFCRTTVLPIYEARQRKQPTGNEVEDGDPAIDENEAISEITDAFKKPPTAAPPGRQDWRPMMIFVGLLSAIVGVLGVLAILKFAQEDDGADVRVWLPQGASATIGDVTITSPGNYALLPGDAVMDVALASGRRVRCAFSAVDGTAVRFVGDGAVSVDDGAAVDCAPLP